MSGDARLPARHGADDPLVTAPVGRTILRLGLPLAIGVASHALVNLVDLAMVGRLGAAAAASTHVATTVNFVPMILGNAISVVAMALLSQQLGNGDRAAAARFARASLRFMFWLGLVVSVVTALPAGPCVDSMGVAGAVRDDAVHYLVVSNLGCLPMFALMQTTAVMRAAGEVLMPLVILLGANLLNLLLDVVLLFGWPALGVPSVGVVGAAYASVAARAAFALLGWWWLWRPRHRLSLRRVGGGGGQRDDTPAPAVAGPLLRGAWPQVAQIGLRAGLVWWLTILVQQKAGLAGTAALAVTTRLDTMVLFSAIGFANAATAVAGRAVVQRRDGRARLAGLWAGVQSLLFGALLVWCFYEWAEPLLRQFLPEADAAVLDAGVLYLTIAAAAQPFAACAFGAMGALHGAGRMLAPLAVDAVGFLGLFVALALVHDLDLQVVYLVLVGGAAALALLHLALLLLGRWPIPATPGMP